MTEFEQVVRDIRKIIQWYETAGKDILNLNAILDRKDRLGCLVYYLSEEAAKINVEYGQAYVIKKITQNKMMQHKINDGLSAAASKVAAEHGTAQELEVEQGLQQMAYNADILLKAVYVNIQNMTQRVAVLRKEAELNAGI